MFDIMKVKVVAILKVEVVDILPQSQAWPLWSTRECCKDWITNVSQSGRPEKCNIGTFCQIYWKAKWFDKTIKKFHFANRYKVCEWTFKWSKSRKENQLWRSQLSILPATQSDIVRLLCQCNAWYQHPSIQKVQKHLAVFIDRKEEKIWENPTHVSSREDEITPTQGVNLWKDLCLNPWEQQIVEWDSR